MEHNDERMRLAAVQREVDGAAWAADWLPAWEIPCPEPTATHLSWHPGRPCVPTLYADGWGCDWVAASEEAATAARVSR